MGFRKITEEDSRHNQLEKQSVSQLIHKINSEDKSVAEAVEKVLPKVIQLTQKIVDQLQSGGRLFYLGAGTSGRLGILDASECPPTFGSDPDQVIALIAGGKSAVYKAVENAEDSTTQGWTDLQNYNISSADIVVGIAASGTTPYVVHALKECQKNNIPTGCICCNPNAPLTKYATYPIEVIVGPEFVTGSSRMKAGTAQKMILNMLSTATMIRLGHIAGNKMIDVQLTNAKLHDRACRMIIEKTKCSYEKAEQLLKTYGSVREAIAHSSSI